ncbi:hypothetical protein ACWT_4875 [Actinoplanes sp. SE50]|uniref:hypothetical protein n=1 Tax=unclassified Actinoplanes TaxID=2626549 RepID=UPI00023EC674|nr:MULTISPECIES: hypothetical protein [unclassified Actinoplanes]AEV85894.1 hypothetical protein ACPL_5005 [Actinoplanes sp. SE50/110]ATO84290.1 hypothetical protein ACWT_4875 [Actinoplanes sp. SE50]SLM01700.1 hypothetical protein ACSP50_4938 [Actinoplanes sp. SE50/110]
MSGTGVAAMMVAVLLLSACAEQAQRTVSRASPQAPGCGHDAPVPDGVTLLAEDVWAGGGTTASRLRVLPAEACSGTARRPEECDTFPWAPERGLYPLGGRAWLSVGMAKNGNDKADPVREELLLYAPGSHFAQTSAQAALDCGFTVLTVLDGKPATLQRIGDRLTEIVYITPRSVIGMSSVDPSVGPADLVWLAGVAADRSAALTYAS